MQIRKITSRFSVAACLSLGVMGVGLVPTYAKAQAQEDLFQGPAAADGIAAVVNQEVITLRSVQLEFETVTKNLQAQGIPMPEEDTLKKQVLQRLIDDRLLYQEAAEMGIYPEDVNIERTAEVVAENNNFTVAQLRHEVEKSGLSWEKYLDGLRQEVVMDQVRQRVVDPSISITESEIDVYLRRQGINPESTKDGTANDGLVITQTNANHILVKLDEITTDEKAEERIRLIADRLRNGEEFEALARVYSDDGSAPQGGALGWLSPGETVPAFDQAMNQLAEGVISEPIRTQFGWHIIRVNDRRERNVGNEYYRMQARQALHEQRVEPAFDDWFSQVRSQAFIDNRLDPESSSGRRK